MATNKTLTDPLSRMRQVISEIGPIRKEKVEAAEKKLHDSRIDYNIAKDNFYSDNTPRSDLPGVDAYLKRKEARRQFQEKEDVYEEARYLNYSIQKAPFALSDDEFNQIIKGVHQQQNEIEKKALNKYIKLLDEAGKTLEEACGQYVDMNTDIQKFVEIVRPGEIAVTYKNAGKGSNLLARTLHYFRYYIEPTYE